MTKATIAMMPTTTYDATPPRRCERLCRSPGCTGLHGLNPHL